MIDACTEDGAPVAPEPENGIGDLYGQLARFNADLHRLRRERNQALEALRAARFDTLSRLATAAEFKDTDTGAHVMRMGQFSGVLATAMGMPGSYCRDLLYASRLHDVGKIGVPDAILGKPGPLTEAEWAVMRRHPEFGAALLSDSSDPMFLLAAEVALTHHEKFDGSGYPRALAGKRIPLSGRIVAVVDFFDALTMDRCYRRAVDDEQALAMLRAGAGSHFDPEVVEAFLGIADQIIELRTRINAGVPESLDATD